MRSGFRHPSDRTERRAFTLAELLIGVAVSAVVLTAVLSFMASGIENAHRIRKSLSGVARGADFKSALAELQAQGGSARFSGKFSAPYGTGILFSTPKGHSPFVLLATTAATGICDAFSGTAADPGAMERLVIAEYLSFPDSESSGDFRLSQTGHVLETSTLAVLGTGLPGTSGGNASSGTATDLRFPGSVAAYGSGAFVADTGNDRILFWSGGVANAFVPPEWGWRFPRSLAFSGGALFVAEGDRVLRITDSNETGGAFSADLNVAAPTAFDSATVSFLPSGTPPSATAAYAVGGNAPTAVSVSGGTGTLTFSGASLPGGIAAVSISPIASPPASPGGYAVRVTLTNAGVTVADGVFPYFTKGDGRLETMTGNLVAVWTGGLSFPRSVTSTGFVDGIGTAEDFPNSWNAAVRAVSDRYVENVDVRVGTNAVTVSYVEYVEFDCLAGRHVKRERIVKIPVR